MPLPLPVMACFENHGKTARNRPIRQPPYLATTVPFSEWLHIHGTLARSESWFPERLAQPVLFFRRQLRRPGGARYWTMKEMTIVLEKSTRTRTAGLNNSCSV